MQQKVEEAPRLINDIGRTTVIESFDLSGLTDDPRLTAITDFASSLCEAPIALVSIVESERQWFPARTGLEARETSRDASFCAHAMLGDAIMVVPDARLDPRFSTNPLVLGEPNIRFYAGAPYKPKTRTAWCALRDRRAAARRPHCRSAAGAAGPRPEHHDAAYATPIDEPQRSRA